MNVAGVDKQGWEAQPHAHLNANFKYNIIFVTKMSLGNIKGYFVRTVRPGTMHPARVCDQSYMRLPIYQLLKWECTNCGVPNFSSTIFDLSSLEHSNSFSAISNVSSVSSLGSPQAASSPVNNPSNPAKAPSIPTQTATCQAPRNSKLGNVLRVVNI